jgi:peptidoglycan/LPS O-acetylase OafA/YrhL
MNTGSVAAATPADRDRVIDLLRAGSLVVVVLGHWLMADVVTTPDGVRVGNALTALTWLRPATWALQVVPLFFVAGGFANVVVWRRTAACGGAYGDYLAARLSRLLRPTLLFLLVVQCLLALGTAVGLSGAHAALAGHILAQPLWFLGVYVALMALVPVAASLHARAPVATLVGLAGGAVVVDLLRFAGGLAWVGWVNVVLVWSFAQQLGFWYADSRRSAVRRPAMAVTAIAAFAGLAGLTAWGPYPVSMVGLPGQVSNMAPPSVCLLLLTLGQVTLVLLARDRLAGRLLRPGRWAVVATIGSMAMTLYLWHLTVLATLYVVALRAGLGLPAAGTVTWWLTRPVWLAVLTIALAAVAVPASRLERADPCRRRRTGVPLAARAASPPAAWASATAALLVTGGLLTVVLTGLAPTDTRSLAVVGVPLGPLPGTMCVLAGLRLARPRSVPVGAPKAAADTTQS